MEATSGKPGDPGSAPGSMAADGHIHQLIALAAALIRAAVNASATTNIHTDTSTGDAAENQGSVGDMPALLPLGVRLDGLGDAALMGWAKSVEQLDRFVHALQVQAAGELSTRTVQGRFEATGAKNASDVLSNNLLIGRGEANRRLRLADRFLPATNPLTLVTAPPAQPILGTAFFSGDVGTEQALVVSRFTDDARCLADGGRISPSKACELEEALTGHARGEGPEFVRRLGTEALNLLDPDGQVPTEGELTAKQGIFFHRARRGLVHFDGHLTVPQYEVLMATVAWASNPAPHKDISTLNTGIGEADGGGAAQGAESDLSKSQEDLFDVIEIIATSGGTEKSSDKAGPRPPVQGPPPDWATPNGPESPQPDPPPPDPLQPDPLQPDAERSGGGDRGWPRIVMGIAVPEPGSGDGLPGLDPIDPNSEDQAVADTRTRGQQLLDGILDSVALAARSGLLPMNAGMKPQLVISTTEEDLQRRTRDGLPGGIALLPYTGPQPLSLFTAELCDADVTTVVLGNGQEILNVGRSQRLFTDSQRKILAARDIGCTFPSCTRPAGMCEAHHIVPWVDGGLTSIGNGALLCKRHHGLVHKGHWSVRLLNGTPAYTPVYSIDHQCRERINNFHRGLAIIGK